MYINCKEELIDLSTPKIMGILNLTPDSFYDGGKHNTIKRALNHVEIMLNEGATFIDVGGSSTRPTASMISIEEELKRVIPTLTEIVKEFPSTNISIDTFYAKVAMESVYAGACIVNDVSAGSIDEKMFETVAELKVPYILSHLKGRLFDNLENYNYQNLLIEVNYFFSQKIAQLKKMNINNIILDPGFGFTKTLTNNYTLLKDLKLLTIHELPILVGVSRKSMIYKKLGINPAESLSATSAVNIVALMNGANILRVHDVKEANQVINIYLELKQSID